MKSLNFTRNIFSILVLAFTFLLVGSVEGQTYYNMSSGNYTQNFADISNWATNFTSGVGASNWSSVGIIGSGTSVTTGTRTTKSSATFVTGSSGGIQKGTQSLLFLSTGSGSPAEAVAVDLLLNFSNRLAGTISFDWLAVDNASGTRPTSLRIFWSTDGTTFTEITSAQILDQVSPSSGSITNVVLPSQLNSSPNVILRFYNHAGSTTVGSGNRDKIQIDNITITSSAIVSPTLTTSLSTLNNFSQNSSTPSTQQSFTISGDNLSGNVSITPPVNYEISLQSGSGFIDNTSSLNLSVSGGNIVSEPVTIYVRQNASSIGAFSGNIINASTGATDVNVAVSGLRTGTLYSKSTGDLSDLNTWGTGTDGSGTAPSNFTAAGVIYEIRNRSTASISNPWTVSGTGSKVVVGDGTNMIDFTIPSTAAFSGLIDVSNNAELTVENSSLPTFNSLATNSTVEFKDISLNIPLNLSYGNLKLTGTGTKSFQGNTTTILGNLTLSNTQLNGLSSSPFSTIDLKGDLTYVGTVTPPADANSITLRTTGAAGGTQTITGAGNTVRWFRIQATTANTILLSTTGGSSELLLGNATSGGLILIASSTLNMNGNDLTFFPGGSTAFNLSSGTISVSPTTDFTLNKTNSGSLGTINFTPGSNTMGSLTLNHTGSPTNTLTIGNDVVLQGDLTISAGQLIVGASDKFTLNGNLTNNGTLTLENNATIVQGASSTYAGTGTVQVKQTITGGNNGSSPNGRFWYLGSPVSGGLSSILDAAGANIVKYWDEQSASWIEITDNTSALTVGRGHYLRSNTPGTHDLTFTGGSLNNGAYNFNLTANGSSFNGFNLVSNPYASYLKWDDVTKTNVGSTIWYRTSNGANNMVFDTYNSNGNVGTSNNGNGTVSQFIPPMQAFWVRVEGSSTGSITMDNLDRSHHISGMQGMHSMDSKLMFANLSLEKDSLRDQAIVYCSYETTDAQDAFDSEKMIQAGTPQLYSKIGDKKMVINAKNFMQRNEATPLYMNIHNAGTHTIKLGEFNSTFGSIWLEDKTTQQFQNLLINDTYTFESQVGQDIARFVLHFGYPNQIYGSTEATDQPNNNPDEVINWADVSVGTSGSKVIELTANLNETEALQTKTMAIFDMTGRQVLTQSFESGNTQVYIPNANGVYLVQVQIGNTQKVFKVLIQE